MANRSSPRNERGDSSRRTASASDRISWSPYRIRPPEKIYSGYARHYFNAMLRSQDWLAGGTEIRTA